MMGNMAIVNGLHLSRPFTHPLQKIKAGPRGQVPGGQAEGAVDVGELDDEAVAGDILAVREP